jgi:hypothetical protein
VTGIESVIVSLMGKASYDGAKALLFPNTKSGESEAIRKSIYESFESAFTKFFAKYGERFGRPQASFLARQENIDLLVQSLFYSAKNPEEVALNLNGFEDAPPATALAAKEFLALLDGELRRHWDLDRILEEKRAHRQIDEIASAVAVKQGDAGTPPQFMTEAVRSEDTGFRVLFSIWNPSNRIMKLFAVSTKTYTWLTTTKYYGGARSVLRLKQDDTTLWQGETYELPAGESASFDLRYEISSGPRDGRPLVICGILASYHASDTTSATLPSDALYVIQDRKAAAYALSNLESSIGSLEKDSTRKHKLFRLLLEAFCSHNPMTCAEVARLRVEDAERGLGALQHLLTKTDPNVGDVADFERLREKVRSIAGEETPKSTSNEYEKLAIEEQLTTISMKYGGRPFPVLCIPDGWGEPA